MKLRNLKQVAKIKEGGKKFIDGLNMGKDAVQHTEKLYQKVLIAYSFMSGALKKAKSEGIEVIPLGKKETLVVKEGLKKYGNYKEKMKVGVFVFNNPGVMHDQLIQEYKRVKKVLQYLDKKGVIEFKIRYNKRIVVNVKEEIEGCNERIKEESRI